MTETQMLSVKKIKSFEQLKNALKHNHRQIARELGEYRHIDSGKCCLNRVLVGGTNPDQVVQDTEAKIVTSTGIPARSATADMPWASAMCLRADKRAC